MSEPFGPHALEIISHEARVQRVARSVRVTAHLHAQETAARPGFRAWRPVLLTTTYRPEVEWAPGQMREMLHCVRKWMKRRGYEMRYLWVMELTIAGRPHYHVILWLPPGLMLPKPDKQGWWKHGSTRIERARSRDVVGYLAKYTSKGVAEGQAEDIPKGARLSGNGGLSPEGRQVKAHWMCPGWVRDLFSPEDRPQRAPGGGWISRLTGECHRSRWRLVGHSPGWRSMFFEKVEPEVDLCM